MVTTIEPPFAFLEEQIKVVLGDAIEPAQMAFGLVPEVFNSINMVLSFNKSLRMIDPKMPKIGDVQSVVTLKSIRVDDAVGLDHLLHNREQRVGTSIGEHDGIDAPSSFQEPENRDFSCRSASALAFSHATKVTFINFNFASERENFFHFKGYDFSQPSEEARSSVAVNSYDFASCPSSCPGNKVLDQSGSFLCTESAFSCVHGAILACSSVLS